MSPSKPMGWPAQPRKPEKGTKVPRIGNLRYWRVKDGRTTIWHVRLRCRRVEAHWQLHRHASHHGDRWVWQTSHLYDRKYPA